MRACDVKIFDKRLNMCINVDMANILINVNKKSEVVTDNGKTISRSSSLRFATFTIFPLRYTASHIFDSPYYSPVQKRLICLIGKNLAHLFNSVMLICKKLSFHGLNNIKLKPRSIFLLCQNVYPLELPTYLRLHPVLQPCSRAD